MPSTSRQQGGAIHVAAQAGSLPSGAHAVAISVFNEGEPVPDYALSRVTERFYSLPRPGTGRKSTGLGLNFVQEVAHLHGGVFRLANEPGGVRAEAGAACLRPDGLRRRAVSTQTPQRLHVLRVKRC